MGIVQLLKSTGPGRLIWLAVVATVSAGLRVAVVVLLTTLLGPRPEDNLTIIAFLLFNTIVFDIFAQRIILDTTLGAAERTIAARRDDLLAGGAGAAWDHFADWAGRLRITAALFAAIINAGTLLGLIAAYAAYLSPTATLFGIIIAAAGVTIAFRLRRRSGALARQADIVEREIAAAAQDRARALGNGYLVGLVEAVIDAKVRHAAAFRSEAARKLAEELVVVGALGLIAIAALAVGAPMAEGFSSVETAKSALAGILLFGPIGAVVGLATPLAVAGHAPRIDWGIRSRPAVPADLPDPAAVKTLSLVGAVADLDPRRRLGPLNLTLQRGQAIAIAGGNGAGKSRLVALIGGAADFGGHVDCDGRRCPAPLRRDWLTALCSTVPQVPAPPSVVLPEPDWPRFAALAEGLGLPADLLAPSGLVSAEQLSFSATKRLALIHALLDARPFLLLDDFFTGLDRSCRDYVCETLLPDALANGRGILVVGGPEVLDLGLSIGFGLSNGVLIESVL